ncbi:response regulator [bacterium]|nr:response regulator [bacterium]MBU1984357.1 response regulator [bacterium]
MAYNILIVDDSAVTREVLTRTIRLSGMPLGEVYHAANGEEALRVLEKNWADIIFTDINMPVMDGYQLVERLHERDDWERLPVIVVSTEGSRNRVEELQKIGIAGYIRKPFTPEQVAEMIQKVMGEASNA